MSDLRPAAQWPDSGARAKPLSVPAAEYDAEMDAWVWGKRADGYVVLEGDDAYTIESGSGVSALRATLDGDTITT